VEIDSVSVNEYVYPVEQRGRFECSDPLLTTLWQACVDTTYLEMEDTKVCDAHRERTQFNAGDGAHGVNVLYAAYGDLPLADRWIRLVPLSDRGDGLLQPAYPPDNPRFMIPQGMIQWSSLVREHFLFTGRRWVLQELYPSVQRQIDWYEPHRDSQGLLRALPGWNWWDWTPVDLRGASFTTNALYVKGLEDAAWLAGQTEHSDDARRWTETAEQVRSALRRVFWDAERGRFEDAHHEGALTGVASEVANALALLYGIATADQGLRIRRHFRGEVKDLVESSPLYMGRVAEGLLEAGFGEEVLALLRQRYALMLESTDAPTIWECWDPFTAGNPILSEADYAERERSGALRPAGVRSLAHTGGALPAYVLSTYVLGVMPTGPGFERCAIHPRTADLDWAKGVMPAPQGDIQVAWTKENGTLSLDVQIPEGVEAEVVLERDPEARQTILHNGVPLKLGERQGTPEPGVTVAPELVRLPASSGAQAFVLSPVSDPG
jgi:hypothetical protein